MADRRTCIHMNGDEQIAFIRIGELSAFMDGGIYVGGTGVQDLYIGKLRFEFLTQLKGYVQANIFFKAVIAFCAIVAAAMSRINNDGAQYRFLFRRYRTCERGEQAGCKNYQKRRGEYLNHMATNFFEGQLF